MPGLYLENLADLLAGLHGQFPGGGEDQHLDMLFFWVDPFHSRDAEGSGLAVPVWERPMTSRPARTKGMLFSWISVGASKPISVMGADDLVRDAEGGKLGFCHEKPLSKFTQQKNEE